MQTDQAESIREVARRIREITDGMAGSRYFELQEQAQRLDTIASYTDRPRRPGQPTVVAHSRGRG